jgi:Tfp pilus assembly protein PilN
VLTKLNLATHPFRNRNLPYLLALFMLAISVAGALIAFAILQNNRRENQKAVAQIEELQSDIDRLNGEGAKIQQQLTPDQQNLLIAAHKLVSNKTFVWSRLFSDLESVLPEGVSASRMVVRNVYTDGGRVTAELDFAVLSHDYPAVQNMIDAMNNSGLFQAELRGQDLQKTDRSTFTEYTLRLIYSPTRSLAPGPTIDVAKNDAGGAQ